MLLMSFKYAEVHRRPPAWKCNSEVVEAATGSFKLKKVYLKILKIHWKVLVPESLF